MKPLRFAIFVEDHGFDLSSSMKFKLKLLGAFRLLTADGEVIHIRSRKSREILAFLSLNQQTSIRREFLASLFWPEEPDVSKSKRTLRQSIYLIRSALKQQEQQLQQIIDADTEAISFDSSEFLELDVYCFEELAKVPRDRTIDSQIRALENAIALYEDDLLLSCYDDWILEFRQYYRDLYLETLNRLTELLIRTDHTRKAIEVLRKSLSLNPFQEQIHYALAQLHLQKEDRISALDQIKECKILFRNELGINLSEDTLELYDFLMRSDNDKLIYKQQSSFASLTNLHAETTSFVGRSEDLKSLQSLFEDHRLITIYGYGGVGKTRLAKKFGRQLLINFEHGVWFIDFSQLSTQETILTSVADVLGIILKQDRPIAESIFETLAKNNILIILDNCEHVVDHCAKFCMDLIRRCPRVSILITSREIMGIQGEICWNLLPLQLPSDSENLKEAHENESIELFVHRAKAVVPSFDIHESNVHAVINICERLDGIPLAIELAASRITTLEPNALADNLKDNFDLLNAGENADLSHHQTLRATFLWSFNLLDKNLRQLLISICIFRGQFLAEAAEDVCSGGKWSASDVIFSLSQLVQKSLVQVTRRKDYNSYALLDSTRYFCAELLASANDVDQLSLAHFKHYYGFSKSAKEYIETGKAIWLGKVDTVKNDLIAAIQWGLENEKYEETLQMYDWIGRCWTDKGLISERKQWLGKILEQRNELSEGARATALFQSGILAFLRAEYQSAIDLLTKAKRTYKELGSPSELAHATNCLGDAHLSAGKIDSAEHHYRKALKLYTYSEDRNGIGQSLNALGNVDWSRGELSLARKKYEESLQIFRETENIRGILKALNNLGGILGMLEEYELAQKLYSEALILNEDVGNLAVHVHMTLNMASWALWTKDIYKATHLFNQAAQICERHNLQESLAFACRGLSEIYLENGDYDTSYGYIIKSINICAMKKYILGLYRALFPLASLHYHRKRAQNAAVILGMSHALREELGIVSLQKYHHQMHEEIQCKLKKTLGQSVYEKLIIKGSDMSIDDVLSNVLDDKCNR